MSPEQETLAALYTILSTDSTLLTATGIDPQTGLARPVAVFNQVAQDSPVPYVRITITDTVLIGEEPMDYTYVPTAKTIAGLLDVYSDYEPECDGIASRLQDLIAHTEVTTAHYHGNSWLQQVVFFVDDTTNPAKIYRRASVRFHVRLNLIP